MEGLGSDIVVTGADIERGVTVAAIGNVLEPLATRKVRVLEPGRTVAEYVAEFWPLLPSGRQLIIAIDGRVRTGPAMHTLRATLCPGQSLVFALRPAGGNKGGKNPIAIVASLALMVAAPQFGAWAAQSVLGSAAYFNAGVQMFGVSTLGSVVAGGIGMAASMVGGMLINAVLPSGVGADAGSGAGGDITDSPTYSWDTKANPIVEGGPVPVLYGAHRVTPPCIGRYVELGEDGKQYLNLLYLVADHAVDSIADCEINGTPASGFEGVTITTRLGAVDQAVIPGFADTISEKAAGYVLGTGWSTIRTDGNAVQGLGAALVCDQGLYYANNSGGLDPQTVTVELEYREVGEIDWLSLATVEITDGTTSPVRRFARADDISAGAQFDVRARRTTEAPTGARYRTRVVFEAIQEIVYDDFRYPGTALAALRIQATDQLSGGMPSVSFLVTRSTVPVWTGAAYETKPASSPAWACWDMLHNEDYGGAVPAARILLDDFDSWADWCATNGYTANAYFDSAMTHYKALGVVSTLGRASVVQAGSRFSCIVDRPDTAVQRFLFTVGNILRDSFREEWLSQEQRANAVQITYFDAAAGYTRQTVEVQAADFDTTTVEINRTSITLVGCTSRAQALAHAQYLLACNRYLTFTTSFTAAVDALACMPGDVIDVSHDVPQWGYSGRVVEADSATITLDRQVTLEPGEAYALTVKYADDTRQDVDIEGVAELTETDTLTIVDGWPVGGIPEPDDLYSFGPTARITKPFRIVSITRDSDQRRRITALEYVAEVYDDGAVIPEPENISSLDFVTGLGAVENLVIQDGAPISSVSLSWRGVALSWPVSMRKQGEAVWTPLGTAQVPEFKVYGLTSDTTYEFRVQGGSQAETITLAYVGLPVPPDVTGFVAVASADGLGTYKWSPVDFLLLQGYELRFMAQGQTFDWDSATILTSVTKGTLITNAALPPGNWTVGAKAVATGGKYSANAATCDISMGNSNALLSQEEQAPVWPGTITDMVRHHTGVLIPNSTALAGDLGWELFDTFVPSPVASCSYESPEIDLASDVARARLWATAEAVLGPGEAGSADPTFEVKYRTESGEYGDWSPWSVGVVPARYVKFRVVLIPATGAAYLRDFLPTVDVAPQTETLGPVNVPAGGGSVAFSQEFYVAPKVFPQVVDAEEPLYPIPSATTKTGCTMHVYDVTGTSVGGTIVAQVTT